MAQERVILVPGLGLAGAELLPLAARLRRRGYAVTLFWHFTGSVPIEDSSRRLWKVVSATREEVVHFVGHSLGGLVVLRMFSNHPWDRPGRIVTLGTPHGGLRAARRLARVPGGRLLLWPGVLAASGAGPIALPFGRELGVLAGSRSLLVGSIAVPDQANDMVIGVSEAIHPDHQAKVVVRETHAGMLLSRRVASLTERFLRQGSFELQP